MKVLVGIDGGGQQPDALGLGAALARAGDGALIVANVYPWSRWSERLGNAYELTVREDAQSILQSAREQLPDVEFDARHIPDMSAPRALHHLAEEERTDVLVIGSGHRGPVTRAVLGTTGDRVVHGSPCPVAVAPRGYTPPDEGLRHIAVAYDGSDESRAALAWAQDLAARAHGDLTVLSVVEPVLAGALPVGAGYGYADVIESITKSCRADLDEAVASIPDELSPSGRLLDGPVAKTLGEAGEDVDVIVAGSRGYGPVGRLLLGSVTRQLMRVAPCPVIMLPRTVVASGPAAEGARTAAVGD